MSCSYYCGSSISCCDGSSSGNSSSSNSSGSNSSSNRSGSNSSSIPLNPSLSPFSNTISAPDPHTNKNCPSIDNANNNDVAIGTVDDNNDDDIFLKIPQHIPFCNSNIRTFHCI